MPSARSQPTIHAIATMTLVGAAFLLTPGNAEATCGSYVIVGGASQSASHEDPAHEFPPVCHGPGCSQLPSSPVIPMSAPLIPGSEAKELSAIFDFGQHDQQNSAWISTPNCDRQPPRLGTSVFHPPRDA